MDDEDFNGIKAGLDEALGFVRVNNQEKASLLDRFSERHNLVLEYYSPTYGDDDDQSCEWRVHHVSGSINDREWTQVGNGVTAADAIRTALKKVEQS